MLILLDIYIMVVGSDHAACQAGFYLAIISATVETKEPEKELDVAFDIVGKPLEKFITVSIEILTLRSTLSTSQLMVEQRPNKMESS